jgi:hypothetical protein
VTSDTAAAQATEVTTVAATIPLDLVMAATPDPVGRSAVLTYQLTVKNNGAATISAVQLQLQIPVGVGNCQSFSDGGTVTTGCLLGRDAAWTLASLAQGASKTVSASFGTLASATALSNGTIIHTTARVLDGAGDSARSATSTAVSQ